MIVTLSFYKYSKYCFTFMLKVILHGNDHKSTTKKVK